jgi:predicted transcriptional regulator
MNNEGYSNEEYSSEEVIESVKKSDVGVEELVKKLGILKKKSWQKQLETKVNKLEKKIKVLEKELDQKEQKTKVSVNKDASVRITKNDIILLKYLFENNFLTREQIGEYIYSSLTYANQRLSKLTKTGFVKKKPYPLKDGNRTTFIMPTRKALSYLKTEKGKKKLKNIKRNDEFEHRFIKPKNYIVRDSISLDQFEHDDQVNKLRFEFENIGAYFWVAQDIAERFNLHSKIPDGIFDTRDRKTKFVLELEKTLKRNSRYINSKYGVLTRYAQDDSIDGILYVVEGESLYKSIMKKINPKSIPYPKGAYKKFYVAKLKEILDGDYRFYNKAADKVFDLREVLNN